MKVKCVFTIRSGCGLLFGDLEMAALLETQCVSSRARRLPHVCMFVVCVVLSTCRYVGFWTFFIAGVEPEWWQLRSF